MWSRIFSGTGDCDERTYSLFNVVLSMTHPIVQVVQDNKLVFLIWWF
jgi:hypothetical protein